MISIFFLFFIFPLLYCNESFLKREYTLSKPFSGSWDFIGASLMTNDYIRLTHDSQSQSGGMYNLYPNTMRDWEIYLNFKIHGKSSSFFGDGLAFWYTSKPLKTGPVFGCKDHFKGLAVFLDTYSNHNGPHHHNHPYISAMVNNGSLAYDHDTDGSHTQLAGCTAQFRNRDHDTILVIRYVRNKLTVSHDFQNENKWTECFVAENVKLPLGYYFGVSAATGQLSDNHDIISIKSYEIDVDHAADPITDLYNFEPFAEKMEAQRDHVSDEKPYIVWKILKVIFYAIVFVCCCAGVAFSFYLYKNNQEQKKRFY